MFFGTFSLKVGKSIIRLGSSHLVEMTQIQLKTGGFQSDRWHFAASFIDICFEDRRSWRFKVQKARQMSIQRGEQEAHLSTCSLS